MPLPKWLAPVLIIALVAMAGGWIFLRNTPFPEVAPLPSEVVAGPIRTPMSEATPDQIQVKEPSLVLHASGTWQDPEPDMGAVRAQSPMPPWLPSYDAGGDPYYRDGQRYPYPRLGYPDHRKSASWLDSFCPWPKAERRRPAHAGYPGQPGQLDGQGYRDAFEGAPPFGYTAPRGR